MEKKLNGFNNGRDTTDGVGGKPFDNMENRLTLEELSQWVIDNRYPKSESEKVSDSEMYHFIIDNVQQ